MKNYSMCCAMNNGDRTKNSGFTICTICMCVEVYEARTEQDAGWSCTLTLYMLNMQSHERELVYINKGIMSVNIYY